MIDTHRTIVVTGIGVVSPYGVGLDCMQAGMLYGKSCLEPTNDLYPGFAGTTAQVPETALLTGVPSLRYSRTDQLAVAAAQDAITNSGFGSSSFRDSGVVMANTVGGLTEIDTEIAKDPASWFRRPGRLLRGASFPIAHVADAVGEHFGISDRAAPCLWLARQARWRSRSPPTCCSTGPRPSFWQGAATHCARSR